jgi:hypothetical protein
MSKEPVPGILVEDVTMAFKVAPLAPTTEDDEDSETVKAVGVKPCMVPLRNTAFWVPILLKSVNWISVTVLVELGFLKNPIEPES